MSSSFTFPYNRRSFHESQKECEEQKDLVKSLKKDMDGMTIRMTDMKGMIIYNQEVTFIKVFNPGVLC